jgi:Tfp pilus assembly protein PilV
MRIYNLRRLKKRFPKCVDEKGISLIEVIIMVLILGIAIVPLTRLTISNLDAGRTYNLMTQGTFYASEIMEDIIADYMAGASGVRGYDWVRTNWPGGVSNPPQGFTGTVSISDEITANGVTYVTVTVTVSVSDIPDIVYSTWLVDNVFE